MSKPGEGQGRFAVAAFIGMIVTNNPILIIPFSLFLQPVSAEFGWGRGTMRATRRCWS